MVVERLFGSRGVGERAQGGDRVHHSFCFSPPKRERKLSGEDQQEEAKRSKSPEKEDVQQVKQHGSGDEGAQYGNIWEWQRVRKERKAAQAVYERNQKEKWTAFRQSQAAGHGEGGLGLAKGDG